MIPALNIRAPAVAIRFQPANDAPPSTPELPALAGSLARRQERRWPEAMFERRLDLSGLAWSDESPTAARHDALLRQLIIEEAERMLLEVRSGEVACRIQLFRDRFQIDSAAAMQDWLAHAGIGFDQLTSFFRAEILMEKVEQLHWARIERELEVHRGLLSACAGLRRPAGDTSDMDRTFTPEAPETSDICALMGRNSNGRALRRRLVLRVLAARDLERRGLSVLRGDVEETCDRFRESFGFFHASEMLSWLFFSGLSQEAFTRQMQDFSAVLKLEQQSSDVIAAGISLCNAVKSVAAWAERRARAR